MLFATTDTIPQAYTPINMITTTIRTGSSMMSVAGRLDSQLNKVRETLEEKAASIGANGIIGIRFAHMTGDAVHVTATAIRIE